MLLNDLNINARGLIAFHILSLEKQVTGDISNDNSIPYVRARNQAISDLCVDDSDINYALSANGGKYSLQDLASCLKAIQSNLKGNSQRERVRNLLWSLADDLEFDFCFGMDHAPIYSYKWNMVNQIIKNKLFG